MANFNSESGNNVSNYKYINYLILFKKNNYKLLC
jgi:hypothetical protein